MGAAGLLLETPAVPALLALLALARLKLVLNQMAPLPSGIYFGVALSLPPSLALSVESEKTGDRLPNL